MDRNAYQGYEVQKHKVMMAGKMCLQISWVCLALQFVLFLAALNFHIVIRGKEGTRGFETVPVLYRELLWKWPAARLSCALHRNPTFRLTAPNRFPMWPHDTRGNAAVPARELVDRIDYSKVFTSREVHWGAAFLFSILGWCAYPLAVFYFRRLTAKLKENEHIRGSRLITEKEICRDESGILPIGKITIPESLSRRHILIAGQTGSGKSTILIQHLDAIQGAKRRCIANDFKGELVERFYRPEHDLILNPLDSRGLGWTLFNELASKADLTAITGSLIPVAKGEDRFWSAAAQDVLRGVMAYCHDHGKRTNRDLWKSLTSPLQEITEMCRATPSGQAGYTYIQDASSRQALGVVAVLMSYVSWLEFAVDGSFSLRQWATNDASGTTVFITNTEEVSNIMRPYLSLFVDLMGKRLLALPERPGPEKSIHLILDELANMQRLPTVKRLLTAGRSKGAVVEIGIPDLASIESIYGREDAHTIVNACGSKFVLNLGDPDAARFFSELASDEEYWEASTFYSISQNENRGGESHNRQIRTRKVILPSEIMRLSVGEGFLMLPGGNPVRVQIPWTDVNKREVDHPAFILRPGLSLVELEARDQEISAMAENIREGAVPDELRRKVSENIFKRAGRIEDQETLGLKDKGDEIDRCLNEIEESKL